MHTFVIGDIHGCARALDTLLDRIAPTTTDALIILGDFIDRGPNSATVLKRLIQLQQKTRLFSLLGNHEDMLLCARKALERPGELGLPQYHDWLVSGGYETLHSYTTARPSLKDIPADHWHFLENFLPYYETTTHLFVHACAYPDMPLAEQPDYMLRWERFNDPPPHESGKILICGHTPQPHGRPRNIGHAICLDTGVCHGGFLSCLEISSGKLYQTSESGSFQISHIDEFLISV